MYPYSLVEWLFFFYLYCFFGWCFESIYVSSKQRPLTFVNRGFMRGPFLPIYGSGAIMMLVVSAPFQDNLILTYFAGCFGATVLEYVTGVTMEALFKVRYWDYSYKKYNFQGHICLSSTIAWGFFTIGMTRWIHKPVERMVLSIPGNTLTVATLILTVIIGIDYGISFKTAMDIRDILISMEKIREEMERLQRRLDVVAAFAEEDRQHLKEAAEQKIESLERKAEENKEALEKKLEAKVESAKKAATVAEMKLTEMAIVLEQRLNSIRANLKPEFIPEHKTDRKERMEKAISELQDIRDKYMSLRGKGLDQRNVMDYFKRSMLRGNPDMQSKLYVRSLEELKQAVTDRKVDKK